MRPVWGWLGKFGGNGRKLARAQAKELAGELQEATRLYSDADRAEDAVRLLLMRAELETRPQPRLALYSEAIRVGTPGPQVAEARRRKTLMSFELLQGQPRAGMRAELKRIASELEACGLWQEALQAQRTLGDEEAQLRLLTAAGAIDQLEEQFNASSEADKLARERKQLLSRLRDLDALGQRQEALRQAHDWLEGGPDEAVRMQAQKIRARLLRGPRIRLEIEGAQREFALGSSITIGRHQADLLVASNKISRQHLRLFRREGAAYVEDLETRNGTFIGGARMSAALPVGDGLKLELAGEIACRIKPAQGAIPGYLIEVAQRQVLAPLGPLQIDQLQLSDGHEDAQRFVFVRPQSNHNPAYLGDYQLGPQAELCIGDSLASSRHGPALLTVVPQTDDAQEAAPA